MGFLNWLFGGKKSDETKVRLNRSAMPHKKIAPHRLAKQPNKPVYRQSLAPDGKTWEAYNPIQTQLATDMASYDLTNDSVYQAWAHDAPSDPSPSSAPDSPSYDSGSSSSDRGSSSSD